MTNLSLDELSKLSMKISDWKKTKKKGIEIERFFGASWYNKYGFIGSVQDLKMTVEHADDYSLNENHYRISLYKGDALISKFPSSIGYICDSKEEGNKIKQIYQNIEKKYEETRKDTLDGIRNLIK